MATALEDDLGSTLHSSSSRKEEEEEEER